MQEDATILAPQNRIQGRCDVLLEIQISAYKPHHATDTARDRVNENDTSESFDENTHEVAPTILINTKYNIIFIHPCHEHGNRESARLQPCYQLQSIVIMVALSSDCEDVLSY